MVKFVGNAAIRFCTLNYEATSKTRDIVVRYVHKLML